MPTGAGKRAAEAPTEEEKARIVTGPDPDRFYCPHPGCNRSFAELWRLKVHFRAPPDVRGSGKERGHGTELKFCPKCGKDLRPGKHHVGCSAGKSAPRQAAKRQRQQQMSTTTESAPAVTAGTTTEHTSSSWEQAVRRQAVKQRQASEVDSAQRSRKVEACRIETLVQRLDARHVGGPELLFQCNPPTSLQPVTGEPPMAPQHFFPPTAGADMHGQQQLPQQQAPAPHPQQHHHLQQQAPPPQVQQQHMPAQLPHLNLPQHGDNGGQGRSFSPSPLDLFGDPFGASNGHHTGPGGGSGGAGDHLLHHDDHDDLRIPSPPPLPADWDVGPRNGLLFDFDQFDASKRQQAGTSAPLVTVTTAMNPMDMLNPSDDYIWQILFAGENDAVPKRVTAHLHHPPATALNFLDDSDPLLDAFLSDDLGPLHNAHSPQQAQPNGAQQQHQQQHQAHGSPPPPPQQQQQQQLVPVQHCHGQAQAQVQVQGQGQGQLLGKSLDPVQDRLVPVGNGYHHPAPHQQYHQHQQSMLPSLDAVFQQAPPLRNGFGAHHGAELVPPAVKLEGGS